jgi:hypothetical protein
MAFSHPVYSQHSVRIPKRLFSSDSGKPFSHCMVCNKYLLQEGTSYMIEKSVRQVPEMNVKETIFEYAMCVGCSVMMNESLSTESRQRIDKYFKTHVDFSERRKQLLTTKPVRLQPWISKCLLKNTPISKTREYQLVAECNGKNLVFTFMPFVLSLEAIDEITSLLSEKSLGEIDDFMGKYFSGPPEVSEILKRRIILI